MARCSEAAPAPRRDVCVSGGSLNDEELAANHLSLFERQRENELDCPFYRERSPDWSEVTVPFVSAGSWGGQGLHLRGNTEAFTQAASEHKFLEMHGLEHWTHFYTDYGFGLQKAFFDRFLKGDAQAWPDDNRVCLQVRHPGNRFVERLEREWPLARTQWQDWHLDCRKMAMTMEPPEAAAEVTYDGLGDGVTFLSKPFAHPSEFTGPASLRLRVASSTEDADLFVVLRLFGPDMKEVAFIGSQDPLSPVTLGWLRASHRKLDPARCTPGRPWHTHDERQPLQPGVAVDVEVELWPFSIVVPAGYRLGLSVRGRDYVSPAAQPGWELQRGRPARNGVGAMFRNDPEDRPPAIFGGKVTLSSGPDIQAVAQLPGIPA